MTSLTRLYRFSASHRLHTAALSSERNADLYGKCNNPFGHGHDYVLEVTVTGDPDPATGKLFSTPALDRLVASEVMHRFEHRNLNLDIPAFAELVPTTENIALVIAGLLAASWSAHMPPHTALTRVFIRETDRNSFEVQLHPQLKEVFAHV